MFKILSCFSLPLLLVISLFSPSCSKEEYEITNPDIPKIVDELEIKCETLDTNNFVSLEQVREFANKHIQRTKGVTDTDITIKPYGKIANTPILYIIDYGNGNGWQIISSDTRTPAIIAEGKKGSFSLEDGNPAVRIWLEMTAQNIASVREAKDDGLIFTKEDINAHRQVWQKEEKGKELRGIKDPNIPEPENGYWQSVLYHVEHNVIDEEIEHLTPHWDQDRPYNVYCPSGSPAGCVAIAASEVLYYLHSIWGIPATMVTEYKDGGFCNESATAWSQMKYDYRATNANAEAILISYVGDAINMHYHDKYSWALPSNIRTLLFPRWGIYCSQGGYRESIVEDNLFRHLPVIVTASDFLIPADFDIHCFVIDGFVKMHDEYTYYNYWVPADPRDHKTYKVSSIGESHEPYYNVSTSRHRISAIKINWGWASQWRRNNPLNDGWYTLTSDWTVTNGPTYSYNYNVNMIYNLSH